MITVPDVAGRAIRPAWDGRRVALAITFGATVVGAVASFRTVGLSPSTLVDGVGDIGRLLTRMVPPIYTEPGRWMELTIQTFFIALAGTAIATAISFPLAFVAARNTTPVAWLRAPARAVIVGARAIPDLVFALIFVRALGLGVVPGVLALGLHSVGMIGKRLADAIEEIDEGPHEAMTSTGSSRTQALASGVLPQVMPTLIGIFLYRLDINVRVSVILGLVGAGGIGFVLQTALRGLSYDEALGIVSFIFVLILAVELLSAAVRRAVLGGDQMRPGRAETIRFSRERLTPPWTSERVRRTAFGFTLVAGLVVGFRSIAVNPVDLLTAVPDIARTVLRLFPPSLGGRQSELIGAMVETVAIAVAATALGLMVALPLGFLAARNVAPHPFVFFAARVLMVVQRGVPEVILAVVFVAGVGLGPFAGTMALAIGAAGLMAKLFADAIEEVAVGPRDAVRSAGATRLQESTSSVLSQAMPSLIGSTLYALDVGIRGAAILGIVGAGGIGFWLNDAMQTLRYEEVGGILMLVFGTILALELASNWVRRQLL